MTSERRRAPRQQIALSVSGAVQIGTMILLGTVVAVYVGERASPFAVSVAASVYALSRILFAPVWGALADVTGRRRTVLLATAGLGSVAAVPFVFVTDPWVVIALRGVYGGATAGLFPVLLTLVNASGDGQSRGRSIGGFNSVRSIGFAAAQLVAGVLIGVLASRDLFAVIVLVNVGMTLTILPIADTTRTSSRTKLSELGPEVRRRLLPTTGSRDHLTTNGLHWLFLALTLRHVTWTGIYSLLPVYFIVVVGTTPWEMGLLLALAPGGEILGMLLVGRLADTLGRKPLVTYGLAGHGVMALLLAAASVIVPPVGTVVAGAGLLAKAAAFSALFVGSVAFIGDVAPAHRESELMGVRSSALGIGGVFGPLLVGSLATLYSYQVAFVAAGSLVVVAAVLSSRYVVESNPGATRGSVPAAPSED